MAKYSQFVRLMKITLPLIAVSLIGLLAAWPSMRESGDVVSIIDRGQTEVINAKFFGRDKSNRPYSISTAAAIEVAGQQTLVDLIRPIAEFTQSSGSWVTMRSDRGRFDQGTGLLHLVGNVHVLRDDGMEFSTRTADVDTEIGTAWGDERTVGQGPSGEILADGFRLYDHGETVSFLDASSARIAAQSSTESR